MGRVFYERCFLIPRMARITAGGSLNSPVYAKLVSHLVFISDFLGFLIVSEFFVHASGFSLTPGDLKAFVLAAVDKTEPENGVSPNEILFGPESRLGLDSLDALQISMAIQKRFGIRMPDSKETRRALASLATLAEYLQIHAK